MSTGKNDESMNVRALQETITETSVVLFWDKPEYYSFIKSYEILVNEKYIGSTSKTCFKVTQLKPDTEYAIFVKAIDFYDKPLGSTPKVYIKTLKAGKVIDVSKDPYNAPGDGSVPATAIIQKAIDDCPDGGTVHIPEGTYKVSGLFLKSDMTLLLDGTLIGSEIIGDYPTVTYRFGDFAEFSASMLNIGSINAPLVRNVRIMGKGTINANGELLIAKFEARGRTDTSYSGRNSCFTSINCENIYIDGVSFKNSACWCVHPIWTENITFYGVYLNNTDYKVHNGDGINPDACKNVHILNCIIESQDDNISIKNGNRDDRYKEMQRPCEDIFISDCILREGFGFSPGLETYYGVRRVTLRDCEFHNASSLCHAICGRGFFASNKGISEPVLGGTIDDIYIRDVLFYNNKHKDNMWMRGPIDIDMFYTAGPMDHPDYDTPMGIDEFTPHISNIKIENAVIIDESDRFAITMAGFADSRINNIVLKNIYVKSKYGLKGINLENVTLDNVRLENEEGVAFTWHNAKNRTEKLNLVSNPAFEAGDKGWTMHDTRMITSGSWCNENDIHSGKYSLKLNSCRSYAMQEIRDGIESSKEYILGAYGKILSNLSSCSGNGYVKLLILDSQGRVKEYPAAFLEFDKSSYAYKQYSLCLPEGTAGVRIDILTDGPVFFVDNIALYPA